MQNSVRNTMSWQKIEWCGECLQPLQHKPYVFTQGDKDVV